MTSLLGLVLISFLITSFLLIPFIDLLFFMRRRYKKPLKVETEKFTPLNPNYYNPVYKQVMVGKDVDTPVGGGILIVLELILLSLIITFFTRTGLNLEILILILTILSFGLIGFIDDIRKIFADFKHIIFPGLEGRYIFVMQSVCALIVSSMLYFGLGFNNIFIPFFGNIVLGLGYIPLAAFVIVSFSNAFNISDGLDGLSSGLLLICLVAFLVLANSVFDLTLASFVGIWIGALIAYLYFNVYPARIYLGDAGAYGFGATLGVIGLMSGKILALGVIGGVYVIIILSSMIQIISKRYFKRRAFPIAPFHLLLRHIGWEEPKVVVRLWLLGAIFAVFGLYLALLIK